MPQPPTATENRSYAAAHFALELDGKDNVGLFRSIEGGGVKAGEGGGGGLALEDGVPVGGGAQAVGRNGS